MNEQRDDDKHAAAADSDFLPATDGAVNQNYSSGDRDSTTETLMKNNFNSQRGINCAFMILLIFQ